MGINHPLPYTTLYPPIAQYIHVRNVLGRVVILNPTRGTKPAVPAEECVWAIGLWHVHPLHVRKLPVRVGQQRARVASQSPDYVDGRVAAVGNNDRLRGIRRRRPQHRRHLSEVRDVRAGQHRPTTFPAIHEMDVGQGAYPAGFRHDDSRIHRQEQPTLQQLPATRGRSR